MFPGPERPNLSRDRSRPTAPARASKDKAAATSDIGRNRYPPAKTLPRASIGAPLDPENPCATRNRAVPQNVRLNAAHWTRLTMRFVCKKGQGDRVEHCLSWRSSSGAPRRLAAHWTRLTMRFVCKKGQGDRVEHCLSWR